MDSKGEQDSFNTSLSSQSNRVPSELETSEEWTILSMSLSLEEDGTTKKIAEDEMIDDKDSQSDIEEIDEETENDEDVNTHSMDTGSIISQLSGIRLRRRESINLDESTAYLRRRVSIESNSEGLIDPGRSTESMESSAMTSNRDELCDDVDLSPGSRAYTHTPNSNVNLRLNLMLCFAITAVISLGIGNYIGWSTNWRRQKQQIIGLNTNHVAKLRSLQDELVACMQRQSTDTIPVENDLKVCHQNADYWKDQFDTLFRENKGLKDILVETQKHYWNTGHHNDIFSSEDCTSGTVAGEFHKLKLDLLVKQMEHLQVLRTFEEVKYQEKLSKQKLKQLEEENSELRAKLIEEEDDKMIASTMEGRISQLELENIRLKRRLNRDRMTIEAVTTTGDSSSSIQDLESKINKLQDENTELKEALRQLESQVELAADYSIPPGQQSTVNTEKPVSDDDASPVRSSFKNPGENDDSLRIDSLRQRINSMVQENEDLKSIIARLRWSGEHHHHHHDQLDPSIETGLNSERDDMDISSLEYQIEELKELLSNERDEVHKWKSMYEDIITKVETGIERSGEVGETRDDDIDNSPGNRKYYDWLYDINFSDIVGNGFSSGSRMLVDAMKTILEKASEARKTIPDDMHRKINVTMSTLNDFQEKMWQKWAEIREMDYFSQQSPDHQKTMIEMTELLISSLRKLQDIGTKFATNTKPVTQKIDKLTSKMLKIMENLEAKWQQSKEKLYKNGFPTFDESDNEDLNEMTNWYLNRAKSRRTSPIYPERENEKLKSWLFRRARDREAQRVKGDDGFRDRGL